MKYSSALEDILRGAGVGANGERYHYDYRTEPLAKSIKRRARMIWECWTIRPDRDFEYDFRPFRQKETITTVVYPGDPRYEKADGFSPPIIKHMLTTSPWISLLPGNPPTSKSP